MSSLMFKIRGGADTYIKPDGSVGTAGKGPLVSEELAMTLAASQDQTCAQDAPSGYIVRRLTPTECERLQDFPDGWTDLTGWEYTDEDVAAIAKACGKTEKQVRASLKKWTADCPDGPRYKALGNSMTTSVMRWIGARLTAVDLLAHTPVLTINPLNTYRVE